MPNRLRLTTLACASQAAMQTNTQLIQPGAASHTTRTVGSRMPAFVLPRVSELPAQLEAVAPDSFAGSVGRAAVCGNPSTNQQRGALT